MKLPPGLIFQWQQQQREMQSRLRVEPFAGLPRWVAGADIAFSPDLRTAVAVAVVYDIQSRQIIEHQTARLPVTVPYVPGYLSFREGPVLLKALALLHTPWDVICFDGQGFAHPRRCGLATHLGITLDRPSIGVGKSRLIGQFTPPPSPAGSSSPLYDGPQQIGLVLRTRAAVNPVFVSVGHRMDLESARRIVLACCTRYRIPEPTRQADLLTKKYRVG